MALGDSMEEHLSKLGAIAKELDDIGATIPKEIKIIPRFPLIHCRLTCCVI
jgi:hypothetical protein